MSDMEEFPEGNADSAPADPPGTIPADDDAGRQGGIDSSSVHDAPILHKPRAASRTASARKAFAEAILAAKKETTAKPPPDAEFDPEAATPEPVKADIAAAKESGAEAKPIEAAPAEVAIPKTPPAPTLDPEVRQLLAKLKADGESLAAERAEWEKQRKAAEPAAPDTHSLEAYIDSPPTAYRNWLEAMRGDKFASDDEFKSEVSDFITQLSADVLGVPLPESVRVKLDAAQAKKIVKTHKTIQTRKEAAEAARLEKERAEAAEAAEKARVEEEWTKASAVLSQQFTPTQDAEGKPAQSATAKSYPWLAAEDEPGKIIVDVIRAAMNKDGTQISWQEASKRANDYLADQAKKYYDKRKPLLASDTAPAEAKPAPKPAAPPSPTPTKPAAPVPSPVNKWSRDKHMENTKAAFRAMIAGKQE